MIFIDDKQHATNIKITSITRHQKCFSTSNTKVKQEQRCPDRKKQSGQHDAYLDETLRLGVAMCQELLFAKHDDVPFTNIIRYIFIVRRFGKQSKLLCPYRTLSLTQSELNLRIHGPNAHAGADSQAFLNLCFKLNSLTAH